VVRQDSAKVPPPVRFWASPPIVLLVAAFVATAIAGPLIGVRQLDAASNAQVRLADTRGDLDALFATQLAEETALRGYVATRDPNFLEPDGPPNPRFDQQARALAERVRADNIPGGPAAVEQLRQFHHEWEQGVGLPLRHRPVSPDSAGYQAYGKVLTDQMRAQSKTLRRALTAEGERVQATLKREIDTTVALSVGVVTVFAMIAFTYAAGRAQAMARLAHEQSLVDALQRTLRVAGSGLPCTRIGSAYASATAEALVGGDVLDVWRAGPDRGWILVADASGKGIEAARHSAFAQYALRALASESEDPGEIVGRFNRLFLDTFDDPSVFVVLFLGAFDARTPALRYASAGHGTAYVRRGSLVERLPPTGTIVGIDTAQHYATVTVPLEAGDVVLLATDGLSEARDASGELLGEERIAALFADGSSDPQTLCDRLLDAATAHSGGVQDDLAIVALRVVKDDESSLALPFSPLGQSAS
jgi:serine phosphatase RsbU (regulator of sigma subunit)